jgi:hypothetical protein
MSFLDEFVTIEEVEEDNCVWLKYQAVFNEDATLVSMAEGMAKLIMETRCPAILYNQWHSAFDGSGDLSDIQKQEVRVYIKPSIGLPGQPATYKELQAVVAEYLWYEIVRNRQEVHELVDIHAPSLHVTEPGGDGLALYQSAYGSYIFRLWEVKKHTGSGAATSKINKASKQLESKGAEYLAKLSKVGQERDHEYPGLSGYYAELVRKWIDASDDVHAGVSVSKDDHTIVTDNPIGIMKRHLPRLSGQQQLSAIIISIPSFVELTEKVREALWKDI